LSFLDDPDEPAPSRASRRSRGADGADPQTLWLRRGLAIAAGLLVVVLLVFVVRGCLENREERAYRDYTRDVTALVQESNQESRSLFGLLGRGDLSPVEVQNQVNGFRVQADRLVERAREIERPDDLAGPHRYLVDTLEFRRDGLGAIGRLLPTALGEEGRADANRQISGQMLNFLASDVIYSQRFVAGVNAQVRQLRVAGATVPRSEFLVDDDWLRTSVVADRIGRIREGGGEQARAGLHGTALLAVNAEPGGQVLNEGPAAVEVPVQGESEERNVTVQIQIERSRAIEDEIPTIAAGESANVTVPITRPPPTGRPVSVRVKVVAVPGERKTDNNEATYTVVFGA
jgi:hypothetical protein